MDKYKRTPILEPLALLLKSRRVLVALITLLMSVLLLALPDLAPVQGELLTLLLVLALALIGGYSLEDAAQAARTATPADDVRAAIREVVDALIDESHPS